MTLPGHAHAQANWIHRPFPEFAKRGPMSTEAIPHVKTNDLPKPIARDDSWRIMAEQQTATGTRSCEELR
jgi:hypothetical protein